MVDMTKIHAIKAESDPTVAPTMVNQHWTNISTGYFWLSKGVADLQDWVQVYPPSGAVLSNTTTVTSASYTVSSIDYYIGIDYTGPVVITLGSSTNGRELIIKDESGLASQNRITLVGNVDGDEGGAILAIDNGSLSLIYNNNSWRVS